MYVCMLFHDTWLPSWVYLTNRGHAAGLLCALWQHCDQEPPLSRDCTSNSTRNPASRGKFHLPPLTPACFVVQVLATVEQHAMRHKRYIKPILSLSVDFYVSLNCDFDLCGPSSWLFYLSVSHTHTNVPRFASLCVSSKVPPRPSWLAHACLMSTRCVWACAQLLASPSS